MPDNSTQYSQGGDADVESLVNQSRFIFKGEIKKINAATLSFGKISEAKNIARVKVSEIIHAPKILGNYTGKDITVQLQEDAQGQTTGAQIVFFTSPWLYANESIAVQEVGRVEEPNTSNIRNQVADAIQKLADEEMKSRISAANLILIGKVTGTNKAESTESEPDENGKPFDEDEKLPYEADVIIDEVIKGNFSGKEIKILFDNNMDFSSYQAPKFKGNEYGIFFLKRDEENQDKASYSIFDQGDFQSMDKVDQIKRFVNSAGG